MNPEYSSRACKIPKATTIKNRVSLQNWNRFMKKIPAVGKIVVEKFDAFQKE